MHRTRLTTGLWVVTIGLWVSTFAAAIASRNGAQVGWETVMTRPAFSAFAASLSIGLVAWQLTRPLVGVSVMYAMGWREGVHSVSAHKDEDRGNNGAVVTPIRSRR